MAIVIVVVVIGIMDMYPSYKTNTVTRCKALTTCAELNFDHLHNQYFCLFYIHLKWIQHLLNLFYTKNVVFYHISNKI